MKTLTIFRHAKSSWSHPDLSDHDRPLNKRGERDAPIMGERLKAAGIRPSLIISSSAVRAWKTAKIVARQISYPPEFLQRESDLYHAGINGLYDVIGRQDEGFNSILVVGHNPGMTDFANNLLPGLTSNLPTAGFVAISIDSDDWNLRERDDARLIEYNYPKKPG
jgi:phosphohistidine phosphatase